MLMTFQLSGEGEVTRQRQVDSRVLVFANDSRLKGLFNDVIIEVEKESFPANRLILACYSRYFKKMFIAEMKERYEFTIEIKSVDKKSWNMLLNFVYTGSVTLNCENVVPLLAAADYLQIDDVVSFCFEFIESVISVNNCFNILNVAHMYNNVRLQRKVYNFFAANFVEVSQRPGFKNLTENHFVSCVSNLIENDVDNTSIYKTIIDWTKVDKENRKQNLFKLFTYLDFRKMSSAFLKQVVAAERLVTENLECSNLLMKSTMNILHEKTSAFPCSKIFSIGGESTASKVSLIYNLFDDVPQIYPDVPQQEFEGACVLKIDDFVYCVGGCTTETSIPSSLVWRLNVIENNVNWEKISPMATQRCYFGASAFRNVIVVAGGRDNTKSYVDCAEVYHPSQNQWSVISSLNKVRCYNALVTCENCVYALGGCWNEFNSISSVEKLNDVDGKWEMVAPMSVPRDSFAAVACKGKLYAIGGYCGGKGVSKSVERYCPQSDKWLKVGSINHERYGHSACVLHGKIYIAGGKAHGKPVKSIECYDTSLDLWSIIGRTDKIFHIHSVFVV